MTLMSSAFKNNGAIPQIYTGDGQDISPPLEWTDVPAHCRGFVLFCTDPDASSGKEDPFVHWVVYNIPTQIRRLPEGLPVQGTLQSPPCSQGQNSFGKVGYGGPRPPRGVHHYIFELHAIDTLLNLFLGEQKDVVMRAIHEHLLATAKLVGTYEHKRSERTA